MAVARNPLRVAATALVLALSAFGASAHGGGVLDLEPIEVLVSQRAAEVVGKDHRVYAALSRALSRDITRPFFTEIDRLSQVAALCQKRLAADAALIGLLNDALSRADAYLDGRDEQIVAILRNVERSSAREQTLALSAKAVQRLADARDASSDRARATELRRAGAGFARAESAARREIQRQFRRGAPGQSVSKGPSGTIDTYLGSGLQSVDTKPRPALGASLSNPVDISIDRDGLLYVVDLNNNLIRRLDADGLVRPVVGTGRLGDEVGPPLASDLHHPSGVAFHPLTGEMFIAGWHSARVLKIDAASGNLVYECGSGELGFDGDGGDAVSAVVDYPSGVAFAADGTWYVADQGNRRVRAVSGATNVISTVVGNGTPGFAGDDGDARLAELNLPNGQTAEVSGRVCLTDDGRFLYVADTDNHRVRRVDLRPDGGGAPVITTFAGTGDPGSSGDDGPAVLASIFSPVDIECDAAGNLYICERDGCRVRRVDHTTGTITTVAGSGARGFAGDGGAATAARLDLPTGITIDRARGRIYIADTLNQVIRVVWE